MRLNNFFKLIISIVICEFAGVVGSFFTVSAVSGWYADIEKPALNPPGWVFAPVWITLYALMGIAAFLIWEKGFDRKGVKVALGIFIGQLVLNALWPVIFFGRLFGPQSLAWAFIEIIVLWLAILAAIIAFSRVSKTAVWLLVPYILWVSFAGYLNYSIFVLNLEKSFACTMEAKLCPDGSYVGRTGPKCEFSECPATKTINLFYYDYDLDKDESGNIACSRNGLVPVKREIPITQAPIQDAIKLLLSGNLTVEEHAQGINTEYPLEGLSLKGASLKDGVLMLEFSDSQNKTVGGSCRVGVLWFQIEATAKQFSEVKEVHFLPEEIFQP